MKRDPPPPVLDSARVHSYAFVDDIPYRQAGALYVDGKLLERVPQLAICTNLGEDIGPLLFHCDEEWTVLGTSGAPTVEEAKEIAERNYPGVAARWVNVTTTIEDALRYYDEQSGGVKCSFCGKRPFEVERWVVGDQARICNFCVEEFHSLFGAPPAESGSG